MKDYMTNLGLGSIFKPPAEEVCPLTKQLIVERLRDLAADTPCSVRSILAEVFADGIADDHQLLDKLEKYGKETSSYPADMEAVNLMYDHARMAHIVRFQSKKLGLHADVLLDDDRLDKLKPGQSIKLDR